MMSMYETEYTPMPVKPQETASKVAPAPPGTLKKVRVRHLREMKEAGRPIVMVTAYDAPTGEMADAGGIDLILVGDSVGMVVHGFDSTLPVSMEMMEMHTAAVARGAKRAMIVADMPFMSYQASVEDAVRNAGRLMKAGAEAVKLEGNGDRVLDCIAAITEAGIPVMGHLGLTPQSVHALSGYRVQGREKEAAERLVVLAKAQEKVGVFAVVAECIPDVLATRLSAELIVPVIGIGAGNGCDGQVLVCHDMLGMTPKAPSFARRYVDLRAATVRAFRKYGRDVRERLFPEGKQAPDSSS